MNKQGISWTQTVMALVRKLFCYKRNIIAYLGFNCWWQNKYRFGLSIMPISNLVTLPSFYLHLTSICLPEGGAEIHRFLLVAAWIDTVNYSGTLLHVMLRGRAAFAKWLNILLPLVIRPYIQSECHPAAYSKADPQLFLFSFHVSTRPRFNWVRVHVIFYILETFLCKSKQSWLRFPP